MKLRNRKTGEIGNLKPYGEDGRIWVWIGNISNPEYRYDSLAELNEEWEDAPEEPKEYWYIDCDGEIEHDKDQGTGFDKDCKDIGNYFETKEEAEKAVERLRAWKRLKDKGFRFVGWCDSVSDNNPDMALFKLNEDALETDTCEDLDTLFGGEE